MVLLVQSALFKYSFWEKILVKLYIASPLGWKVTLNDLFKREVNNYRCYKAQYRKQAVNQARMRMKSHLSLLTHLALLTTFPPDLLDYIVNLKSQKHWVPFTPQRVNQMSPKCQTTKRSIRPFLTVSRSLTQGRAGSRGTVQGAGLCLVTLEWWAPAFIYWEKQWWYFFWTWFIFTMPLKS